jgi:hypothetical protein
MRQMLVLGPQDIQSGVWKIAKAGGPLWAEGSNVVFRDLGVRSVPGALQQADLMADQTRDIVQANVAGERRAYVGTDTDIEMFSLLGGTWSRSVLGTWPTAGQYADLETWGTWLIATNGVDPVKIWKNGGGLVDLAGTPFTKARIVKRASVFLLAFNTDNIGPSAVEWSSDSNPEDWTPSLSNKAGNFNIRDLDSEIVCVADLGSRLAVYSRARMVLGTYIGGTAVWSWVPAVKGIGAVSNRSVVTLDPFNYGLTRDGIFKTDGNSFAWVDDPAMLRYIRQTADFSREELFWGFADTEQKSVGFYFQNSDAAWRSVNYYPETGIFTTGDLSLTAGASKEVFNYPLVTSEGFRFGTWGESQPHFGTPVTWSLKTNPLDFGTRDVYKIHNLTLVEGQWSGANIRIRAHESPEDAGTIFHDAALVRENYADRDAKFLSWELYGSGPFYMTRMEVFGIPGGLAQ